MTVDPPPGLSNRLVNINACLWERSLRSRSSPISNRGLSLLVEDFRLFVQCCPNEIFVRCEEISLVRSLSRHPDRQILLEVDVRLQGLDGEIDGQRRSEEIRVVLFQSSRDRPETTRRDSSVGRANLFDLPTLDGPEEDHDRITFRVVQLFDRRRSDVQQTMTILNKRFIPSHFTTLTLSSTCWILVSLMIVTLDD